MIHDVRISKLAQKQLRKLPRHVAEKLRVWVALVCDVGIEEARKVPGYHDEPLQGQRAGQRSIRLNRAYRAFYVIGQDGSVEFVCVEEVNKHDY